MFQEFPLPERYDPDFSDLKTRAQEFTIALQSSVRLRNQGRKPLPFLPLIPKDDRAALSTLDCPYIPDPVLDP